MYVHHERNNLVSSGLTLGLCALSAKLIWTHILYVLCVVLGFILCLVTVVYLNFRGNKYERRTSLNIKRISIKVEDEKDSMSHSDLPLVSSLLISKGLERTLSLAIENYVVSWYGELFINSEFPHQLNKILAGAVSSLAERLEKIQLDEFLVLTTLPILTNHFKSFCQLEVTCDGEKSSRYAHFQSGNLHPAIGADGLSKELLIDHLKNLVEKKLSRILPENELNKINRILLVEIMSSCVLFPVLSMLSDPDFFNRTIAESVGSLIKDRDQVKQFRNVLDEHSSQGSSVVGRLKKSRKVLNAKKSVSDLAGFKISPGMSQTHFEGALRRVQVSHSTIQLKHLRYFLSIQLGKAIPEYERLRHLEESSESANLYKVYIKRLQLLRMSSEARLKKLIQKSGLNPENYSSHFDPTLKDVLENPSQLPFFQEFMEERGRERLLQFWIAVTAVRDPLENLGVSPEDDPLTINYEVSQAQEVRTICHDFADVIPEEGETRISQYLETDDYENYVQAKVYLSQMQNQVYERMERSDFLAFKKSDCFLKLVAAEKFNQNDNTQDLPIRDNEDYAGDPLAHYEESDEDEEHTMLSVQDALDEIMKDGRSSKRQLFPDFSTFQDESEGEINDMGDETLDYESDSLTNSFSESFDETKLIQFAPPNQLNLGEEIKKLTVSLSRLKEQMEFLSPLLNKAELTNNTGELRILRKSYSALEREVELQNRQVQQYVIQENENSLFGKTKVRIQSYIKGSDEGKRRYILYILEVERFTGAEEQAGWIVARRFSQFHSLHEYLKKRFPEVQALEFPKKKVVMKFQQKMLVEERKEQLQEYLRSLLEIPQVCLDGMFRLFLSSEDFNFHFSGDAERLTNRLYYGIYNRIKPAATLPPASPEMMEMQHELEVLDNAENRVPFVRPVCDFIIALFSLDKSGNWLKARAVLVVLQQLLGTAIEKKIRFVVANMTSETKILDYLTLLQTTLWPENDSKKEKKPRELSEKIETKHEAEILLEMLLLDVSSKIFGVSGSKKAANKVFLMFQDEVLNAHLLYQIFDTLIEQLFP